MSLRRFNAYMCASIILFSVAVFITVFPVANYYFSKYVYLKHSIEEGSRFDFSGELPIGESELGRVIGYVFSLRVESLGDDRFLLNMTAYRAKGVSINYMAKPYPLPPCDADEIEFLFTETLNTTYNDSSLLKILIPHEKSVNIDSLRIEPESEFEKEIIYDFRLLGFPTAYREWSGRLIPENPFTLITYIKLGEGLLLSDLGNLPFEYWDFLKDQFPHINSLMEERAEKEAAQEMGSIVLSDTNTVPSDQNWLAGIGCVFGFIVFPIPIVLMAVAVILLIIGVRKGI